MTPASNMTRKFARAVPPPAGPFKAGRSHCEIGFEKLGEREPHFHVLGGTEGKFRNNRWESSTGRFALCANHDDVRKNWPEYAHLVRWHLAGVVSGPMHYEANALHFARVAAGDDDAKAALAVEGFKRAIAWGALPEDATLHPRIDDQVHLIAWLRDRLPKLMAQFRADVEKQFPGMFDAALAAHGK